MSESSSTAERSDASSTAERSDEAILAAHKEAVLRASHAAIARLTPIEREYRKVMAKLSSYQKFLRERTSAAPGKHRCTFLSTEELELRIEECKRKAEELKPKCVCAVARRRRERKKDKAYVCPNCARK
jgi:hypothetical protein